MRPSERNIKITELLNTLFQRAESAPLQESLGLSQRLDIIFKTPHWGFREVVLLVGIARYLNPNYSASTGFYDCNPRALYEGPIRSALREREIPHRKSGPLNIAKATKGLNEEWAAQRRPAKAGKEVVWFVRYIESISHEELESFIVILLSRFLKEAQRVGALATRIILNDDPSLIYSLCVQLIDEQPDRGNTPQRIIGLLLQSYHDILETGISVFGHDEVASVTNTTSKKPADIIEGKTKLIYYVLYEVTAKPFDEQRMQDSHEAITTLIGLEKGPIEVIVLCRTQDVYEEVSQTVESTFYLGEFERDLVIYRFVNMYEWILAQLLRMTSTARVDFYDRLQAYINEPNTNESVKELWALLHTTEETL